RRGRVKSAHAAGDEIGGAPRRVVRVPKTRAAPSSALLLSWQDVGRSLVAVAGSAANDIGIHRPPWGPWCCEMNRQDRVRCLRPERRRQQALASLHSQRRRMPRLRSELWQYILEQLYF